MGLFERFQDGIEQRAPITGHDESVLRQSQVWTRSVIWGLVGTTALAVGWLALAKTEEIVVAPGKLEPIGAVKEVQMPIGGVAKEILVKDGDAVKAGQVVMRLDTEASEQRQLSLRQSQRLKQEELRTRLDQFRLKQQELARYLQLNDEEVSKLEKTLALDREILSRLETLAREGAAGELQYLQQRNKVQEGEGQLMQTRVDRLRQKAILDQGIQQLQGEIASLQSELAEIRSQLTEANVTLRYQALHAPVNGVVFDLKPRSPGFTAQSAETIMKIVPYDKLEARVEIASSDIGFVRTGMPVDISIDSFPATDFGVLEGSVKQIGSDALPPDAQKQREDYRYPATIALASQQLSLRSGKQLPLQVGMSLHANIKLRKVSYLQLLLGTFRDKADSLRQI
ncbi:MAG: HlyD family efflux transporter periplasmic adaptor subunit [Synechococcaceae cyanobacterium]|nr:HlyD family efflux transporter periplasmic adaptor subunit [Synechococcaceae cyanobacterium]